MAIPVARLHLKMAHGALPALLPTPPKWKMLPVLPMTPCVAAVLPKPAPAKPSRADSDERWDAHKAKPGHAFPRKNETSPPPKPGRADSSERWDAHEKAAAIPASSSFLSSGTSSFVSSTCKISRALSSSERWDVHKKRRSPQTEEQLDDGESSSTGSNDIDDTEEEEEIVWKPRAMYAGPGFVAAAPEPRMLPVPTAFLVRVA